MESRLTDQVAEAQAERNRGDALYDSSQPAEAKVAYDRAVALDPTVAAAFGGRGNARRAMGDLDGALADFDRAAELAPQKLPWAYNRGVVLMQLKRLDEAHAACRRAVALAPGHPLAHQALAIALLTAGALREGFREFEWRKLCPDYADARHQLAPMATPEADLNGRTLYIYPERFLGDLIHFSRFALWAERRGARVVLGAPERMHRLLRTLSPSLALVPGSTTPAFDLACGLLSLPHLFEDDLEAVMGMGPYLAPEPARVAHWRGAIGKAGFRIGVCWQGSTLAYAGPLQRSFALAELADIAAIPGVRLISLQAQDGLAQLDALPRGMAVESLGPDFDAGPDAFLDTAAAMMSCDLVLTADTSVAHLAGALGRPTWVALPFDAEWRWGVDGERSSWYPTLRLFRQPARGDWTSVFRTIQAQVKLALETHPHA